MYPDELPLSQGLHRQLLAWMDCFDEHVDEDGWDRPALQDDYVHSGRAPQRRLQAELGEPVYLDLTACGVARCTPAREGSLAMSTATVSLTLSSGPLRMLARL